MGALARAYARRSTPAPGFRDARALQQTRDRLRELLTRALAGATGHRSYYPERQRRRIGRRRDAESGPSRRFAKMTKSAETEPARGEHGPGDTKVGPSRDTECVCGHLWLLHQSTDGRCVARDVVGPGCSCTAFVGGDRDRQLRAFAVVLRWPIGMTHSEYVLRRPFVLESIKLEGAAQAVLDVTWVRSEWHGFNFDGAVISRLHPWQVAADDGSIVTVESAYRLAQPMLLATGSLVFERGGAGVLDHKMSLVLSGLSL